MRARIAAGGALVATVVAFVITFLVTGSLLWTVPLSAAVGLGVYLMADGRSRTQVALDTYTDDADRKAAEALRTLAEVRKLSREVRTPAARGSLEAADQYVTELLDRVRASSPDSLYSTASTLGAHLQSLLGVVRQYLDIQRKPALYKQPEQLQSSGEEAFRRFAEFAFDSIQLVNQGDLASYRANLATVAPPKLPELT
jgi:hypothetical protein